MRRKLTRLLKTKNTAIRKPKGLTITEVVIASALLIIAIVPILKALTSAHLTSTAIEHKTRCLTLAQAKLDEIKARSVYNYDSTYNETSIVLESSYLCDVHDTSKGSDLREIEICVGYDSNDNSTLDTDEIEITLTTLLARRW